MARRLRIEYPGAMYHVMNRGDQREAIFRDDEDRRRFLATLGEACASPSRISKRPTPSSTRGSGHDFETAPTECLREKEEPPILELHEHCR
jgi:hypothetical protein